jgi:RHS repeat-associated protein
MLPTCYLQPGYSYNSNGNLKTLPYGTGTMTLTYDVGNRMEQAVNSNGTERYGYDHQNRRVYQKTVSGTQLIFFYGANGDRLRTYQFLSSNDSYQVQSNNIHFMGRLLRQDSTTIFMDRLGSVRNPSRYYPFGEEQGAGTIPDKFATYYRDSSTGLDYAHHRYYSSTQGRFTTPDPSGTANLNNPGGWNQYGYVNDDPINHNDPSGLGWECLPNVVFDGERYKVWGETCVYTGPTYSANVYLAWVAAKKQAEHRAAAEARKFGTLLIGAINVAREALKRPECAKLFSLPTNVGDPGTFLMTLSAPGNPYGTMGSASVVVQGVSVDAATMMAGDSRVIVAFNTGRDGTFFTPNPSSFSGLPPAQARAATVIHELGHAADFLFGDASSKMIDDDPQRDPTGVKSRYNSEFVEEKCFPKN